MIKATSLSEVRLIQTAFEVVGDLMIAVSI